MADLRRPLTAAATRPADKRPRYQLSVSSFDRTSTLVVTLLISLGATVAGLSIVFFANKFQPRIEPIAFVPVEASSPTGNQGFADEPEPPGVEEASDLQEPQLEDTLSELISTQTIEEALLSEEQVDALRDASQGAGRGDARQAGPGGDGVVERVPRWQRWKIRYQPATEQEFAQWLDRYGVRLAVVGRDAKLHVAFGFAGATPTVEAASPREYISWGQTLPADGSMPQLVRQLAERCGIASQGEIVLLMFPFEVESILWTLEQAKNEFQDPNRVRQTIFRVLGGSGGEFGFEVQEIKYF